MVVEVMPTTYIILATFDVRQHREMWQRDAAHPIQPKLSLEFEINQIRGNFNFFNPFLREGIINSSFEMKFNHNNVNNVHIVERENVEMISATSTVVTTAAAASVFAVVRSSVSVPFRGQ